jgi:hypothetical protein
MSFRILGLDWFEIVVQFALTVAGAVAIDSMFHGPFEDAAMGFWIAGSIALLGYRRKRALAAHAEAPADADRLADVEARLAELEAQQARIYELEERLDFTERMLTQARDQVRLPGARE